MKNVCLIALFVWFFTSAHGQEVIPLNGALKSDVCVVHDSLIFIAYRTNGLHVYTGDGPPRPVSYSIPATEIYALAYHQGALWLGTNNGLIRDVNGVLTQFSPTLSNFAADTVFSLDTLHGMLMVGSNNGLIVQQNNGWQRLHTANSALQANRVTQVKAAGGEAGLIAGNLAYSFSNNQIQALPFISTQRLKAVLPLPNAQYIVITDSQSLRINAFSQPVALPFADYAEDLVRFEDEAHILSQGRIVGAKGSDVWFRNAGVLNAPNHPGRIKITNNGKLYVLTRFRLSIFHNVHFIDKAANSLNRKELDINQVRASYLNGGDMFWDRGQSSNPRYLVPKNPNVVQGAQHSLFALTTWIGGMHNQQLYQSAQTYRQNSTGGVAYQSGPLNTQGQPVANAGEYDRLWKINRFEVESFKQAWQNGGVQSGSFYPSFDFRTWPGNHPDGPIMAPFFDRNNNGVYSWQDGDYPLIKGDQAIWFVYNDLDTSRVLNAPSLGVEVHCMAYAYVCEQATGADSVINYTTFLEYKFINKSNRSYNQTSISLWSVPTSTANGVGMDVQRNGFYFSNYTDYFGTGNAAQSSPAMGIYQLHGPLANANDGIDNNRNGLQDEIGEEIAISNFMTYVGGNPAMSMPVGAQDFNNYANSRWLDNQALVFGGTGYPGSLGSTNLPANFMFSGNTDPVGWGLGGNLSLPVPPPFSWTQSFGSTVVGEPKAVASMGKFLFEPQSEKRLSFALIWSYAPNSAANAINKLLSQDAPLIKQWHAQNAFPSCLDLSTVSTPLIPQVKTAVQIFPNPATDRVFVSFDEPTNAHMNLFDMHGRLLMQRDLLSAPKHEIAIQHLPAGIYLLGITQDGGYSQFRFVKH